MKQIRIRESVAPARSTAGCSQLSVVSSQQNFTSSIADGQILPINLLVNQSASKKKHQNFRYYNAVKQTALVIVIAIVIGLLSALIGCYSGSHPARIGSNAPDFTVQDSDHKVTLSQFRGQVVVLNFWATWCPPCVEETPSLVRMQAQLKNKGVVVLAVSIDADDAAYHKFLKEYGVNMVTVRDEAQKASTLYGTFGWPESYVIDRNGVIRRKFIGAVDWTSPEVTDYLSKL
jgi:peroxiredoxin